MRRGRALMKAMLQAVVSNDARPRDMRDYARLGVTSTAQPVECSATGMVPVPGAPGTPCRQPASRDDFAQAPTRAMMTAARVHRDGMDAGAPHLGSVIAAHLREWDTSPAFVELAIFESDDATEIAGAIDAFCDRHLGGRVARGLFHQSSIGSVTGVELADGRRVVIKAHQPERTRAFLAEIVRIQSHLAERGVFATEVLAGPLPLGRGQAIVERYVDIGATADAHRPEIRRALAQGLAAIIATCAPLVASTSLELGLLASSEAALWPTPHSKLFDFGATAHGAEWIDELAARARERMVPAGVPVIGHGDWRQEHVRFVGDRPVAPCAYTARCGHALGGDARGQTGSFQDLLWMERGHLLEL